ncbi:MAG TPA: YtxH domain-containing protein [Polyangia bacterium]|nr:YtxH domain-containing protein [Polyangia bacterium]
MSAPNEPHRCQPGIGSVLIAMLGGAAAGALAVYLTAPRSGADSRRRLQAAADDARETAHRVPVALRKATEAARDAFNQTLRDQDAAEGA